jgi:folate-dependent phosphoribosylglycinamide formyltransferase PurN
LKKVSERCRNSTNNPDAKVLERAKNMMSQTQMFPKQNLNNLNFKKIQEINPDLIVLAGFY